MRLRVISSVIFVAACTLVVAQASSAASRLTANGSPNAAVFPRQAHPHGADMATWGERASQWVYAQPLEQSPLFDATGANCAVGQDGPVWYVARIAGPPVFSGERACTIPHGKAILLYIGAVVDTYPCPFDWHPAPGQSLYDFLITDAQFWMDTVDFLTVSLDGEQLDDVMSYRFASDDLFYITGDPSLQQALDPCITGEPQPAVVDGFFMMFKPFTRGDHTIVVHGTNTLGHDKTFTYFLTVE